MPENKLTTKRIYDLAYDQQLYLWHSQYKHNEAFKLKYGRVNQIGEAREQKYWEQLKEIQTMKLTLEEE